MVKIFQRSHDFPNLAITLRWLIDHPRNLASVSKSLPCNPAILPIFQSSLHPRTILAMTSQSSLDHFEIVSQSTLRRLRDYLISHGHFNAIWRSLQDTVGPGCDMSTRVSWPHGIHMQCDHNLQNRAPNLPPHNLKSLWFLAVSKMIEWPPT